MLRLSLQTPPDFKEHLGPAVYSSKPWHAERMPIKVKHPPINDARIMPPSEFDHDYTGRMVVQRVDEAGIRDACKGMTQTGCTYHTAGSESCFVWIVYDDILNYQQYSYDVVYRHERAHCNGWHHDRPR